MSSLKFKKFTSFSNFSFSSSPSFSSSSPFFCSPTYTNILGITAKQTNKKVHFFKSLSFYKSNLFLRNNFSSSFFSFSSANIFSSETKRNLQIYSAFFLCGFLFFHKKKNEVQNERRLPEGMKEEAESYRIFTEEEFRKQQKIEEENLKKKAEKEKEEKEKQEEKKGTEEGKIEIKSEEENDESSLSEPLHKQQAVLLKFCLGSALGLTLGHILRRVGRVILAFVGIYICVTEVFVTLGWLRVDWQKIFDDFYERKKQKEKNKKHFSKKLESFIFFSGFTGGSFAGFYYTVPFR